MPRYITGAKLKEFALTVSDDAILVVNGHDHDYREASICQTSAYKSSYDGHLYEDHGPSYKSDENDKLVRVILVD